MNPFEVERLGWEEIRGLPVVADPELGTGRFRIVCSREGEGEGIEETEAIGDAGRDRRRTRRGARSGRRSEPAYRLRPSSLVSFWASMLSW